MGRPPAPMTYRRRRWGARSSSLFPFESRIRVRYAAALRAVPLDAADALAVRERLRAADYSRAERR